MTRKTKTTKKSAFWTSPANSLWEYDVPKKRAAPLPLCDEGRRMGDMLSFRRRYESAGEQAFIDKYILPLGVNTVSGEREARRSDKRKLQAVGPNGVVEAEQVTEQVQYLMTDHAYTLEILHPDGRHPTVAFCAHTDSVHNPRDLTVKQRVAYDPNTATFMVADDKQVDCLGADDAAGCYVLIRMIEAGVPGRYVFFRGEEVGGIGSRFVAEYRQDVLEGITAAIQFDRRGTNSIITEMACGPTCSEEFALALADALGMDHEPDPTGSFTDTAVLIGLVPECTNVSVGYEDEHSARETLDWDYVLRLTQACIDAFSGDGVDLPCTGPRPVELTEDVLADMTDHQIENLVYLDPEAVVQFLMDMRDSLSMYYAPASRRTVGYDLYQDSSTQLTEHPVDGLDEMFHYSETNTEDR